MNDKKLKKRILHFAVSFFVLIVALCIITAGKAQAVGLFFQTQSQKFAPGDIFLASIFLDTEGESINAAAGKIIFPSQLLEMQEVRDGNSIINFWVERPKVDQTGTINFSGIIPGGYQGGKGFLFSIVFQAKSSGKSIVEIHDAKILLNNGKGTSASLTISPLQFSITQGGVASQPSVKSAEDNKLPEEFKPEITQSPDIFDGKWFLVFATQDKGSGIADYQVRESQSRILAFFSGWHSATSPYLLQDQNLTSYIYVKAIDKAGNKRVVVVEPGYPMPWYKQPLIWVTIIVIVGLCVIGKMLWQKYLKSH